MCNALCHPQMFEISNILLLNKKEHYYYAIITVFMGKAVNDKRGQRVAKYSLQAIPSLIASPWLSSISIITGLLLLLIQ